MWQGIVIGAAIALGQVFLLWLSYAMGAEMNRRKNGKASEDGGSE